MKLPNDDQGGGAGEGMDPLPRTEPAALARDAMERAKASAKSRGAYRGSPRAARKQRERKRQESQPFMGGRDPRPMSDAVETLLGRMGWTEQIEVSSVTARWREIVGDSTADHCEPLGFDDGVLTVKASSSAWSFEIERIKGQIRHRMNEEFGREIVKELKVVGPTARNWNKGLRSVKGRGPRDTYG